VGGGKVPLKKKKKFCSRRIECVKERGRRGQGRLKDKGEKTKRVG